MYRLVLSPELKIPHAIMTHGDVPALNNKLNKVQSAVPRARLPPRNVHNEMYCDHVSCTGKNQTFKRVCEWNKHMDRHERPYKCHEPGCELNPGFTYSGGLSRHQREVHKIHLSTKQPLFCPFPNCNRSLGIPFTRKENLEEHKRRRHLEELSDHSPSRDSSHPPLSTTVVIEKTEPQAKRRRISATDDPRLPESETRVARDMADAALPKSLSVLWLRAELLRKDEIIRQHAVEVYRLQNRLRSLPQQRYPR